MAYLQKTSLPKTFVELPAAYSSPVGTFVSIIGVVVDIQPPKQVSSGQWMFTFRLLDAALRDSLHGSQGLTARSFHADATKLPKVKDAGDVVLFRNVKMQSVSGQPVALTNWQTGVLVFPAASIPAPSYSIAYQDSKRIPALGVPSDVEKFSREEQAYVIKLKAEVNVTQHLFRNAGSGAMLGKREAPTSIVSAQPSKKLKQSAFGNKYRTVAEARHMMFSDLCVQIIKKFSNTYGCCELYVTDYTENKDMFYYVPPEEETEQEREGDDFGYNRPAKKSWPGPYGWFVLKIDVFEPHASFVKSQISEGEIVLLRNVKTKMNHNGGKLEGNMWADVTNPEKIKVVKLASDDFPEIKELNARKEKYWNKRNAQHPPPREEGAKPSKSEKKRLKKLKQQEERAKAAAAAAAEKLAGNKHIRCSNDEVGLMSIADILDPDNTRHRNFREDYTLPFLNTQYRVKAHVVDFAPRDLVDFAVPAWVDENGEASPIDDYDASQRWEWYFTLLLEDVASPNSAPGAEKAKMWVHVRHKDAQFLFGNDVDDPCDLRENEGLLKKIKEKLCILWGNLEEKEDGDEIKNRAFECCVQEYGIEVDVDDLERQKEAGPFGYLRMYGMHGVTIL